MLINFNTGIKCSALSSVLCFLFDLIFFLITNMFDLKRKSPNCVHKWILLTTFFLLLLLLLPYVQHPPLSLKRLLTKSENLLGRRVWLFWMWRWSGEVTRTGPPKFAAAPGMAQLSLELTITQKVESWSLALVNLRKKWMWARSSSVSMSVFQCKNHFAIYLHFLL